MSANQRFVLGTNRIVSTVLLPRSIPRQAFDLSFALGDVRSSTATLDELDNVLRRPRFNRFVAGNEQG
jgi:predicted nucleic acid-binding protein